MKQDKDIWVEEVLSSTEGMGSARPRTDLYDKIKDRLVRDLPKGRRIPLGVMSAAAACLLVLVALNITAITKYTRAEETQIEDGQGAGTAELIEYYDLGSNNTGL